MSTGAKAFVTVLASVAVILSVVAILMTMRGDDYVPPSKYDSKAWERAMQSAGYRCAQMGVGGTDANAIYTPEFKSCQREQAELIYAEENDK